MKCVSRYGWLKDYRVIATAVICAIAGFLVAALIFDKPWHRPAAWGDIPTWLATAAATAAGAVAYRVYQVEKQRDLVSDEERRGAQAAKIAAWYGFVLQDVTRRRENSVQQDTESEPVWGAFLRNASDLPVYDVIVTYKYPSSGEQVDNVVEVVLPPNDAPIHLTIREATLRLFSPDPRADAYHRVEIKFTDSQGARWHRDLRGQLKEIAHQDTRFNAGEK